MIYDVYRVNPRMTYQYMVRNDLTWFEREMHFLYAKITGDYSLIPYAPMGDPPMGGWD